LLSPATGQIPKHYSPVRHSSAQSKLRLLPFDLHVLGMPPAFNLSQDQTLQFNHVSCLWQQIFGSIVTVLIDVFRRYINKASTENLW
jgi:hypothetical protein